MGATYNPHSDPAAMRQLIEEWSPLMQAIKNPNARMVGAILADNQKRFLEALTEETFSSNVGSFTKFIFPLLMRVFPNLIANQIFSVQPMNSPVGAISYYNWKYGNSKGNVVADTNLIEDFNRYYSSEFIDYEVKNTGPAASTATLSSLSAGSSAFRWIPIHAATPAKGYILTIYFIDAVDDDEKTIVDDGAGNLVFAGVNVGSVSYTTGAWTVDLAAVPGAPLFKLLEPVYATYNYDQERVTNAAVLPQESVIPEIDFDVTIEPIMAKRRSLKFRTSTEAMDDIRALWGLNGEAMLVSGMSQQMALGLDREMISDVVRGARFGATYQYGPTFGGADVMRPLDSIRELLTTINAVSTAIQKGSNRAPANFIVTSPEISSFFEQLTTHGDFMAVNRIMDPDVEGSYGQMNSQYPINNIGTLLKRYKVYEDPYLESDTLLVGLRGREYNDGGYVYAPYISIEVTPTFLDPNDLTFRKGMRTRYATKLVRPEYYGVITVSGLPTVTVT